MSQWMLEPLQNAADEACEEPEGGAWVGAPASRSLQLPRIEIKKRFFLHFENFSNPLVHNKFCFLTAITYSFSYSPIVPT